MRWKSTVVLIIQRNIVVNILLFVQTGSLHKAYPPGRAPGKTIKYHSWSPRRGVERGPGTGTHAAGMGPGEGVGRA